MESVPQLRPYQTKLIEDLRTSYRNGKRAPLAVMPTGAGKTVTFNYMARSAASRGKRVLICVHRQELLSQASRSLSSMGVKHGIIAPGKHGELEQVAVASIQTLDRRIRQTPISFDFIILDEAHHATASTWRRVLTHFSSSHILGVTATPIRSSGEGLGVEAGGLFDDLIIGPRVTELIELGYLVEPVVYAPPVDLDLTGIRKRGGDFNTKELSERVDKPLITGSAVDHYRKLSHGEPAIAFCASINHAEHVRNEFRAAGYASEVIHGSLEDDERKRMIEGLASGRIQVLTSVDIISEGTDIPIVSTAILLRPTQSLGLYIQQCGRVLRPSPSKARALILDHCGNTLKHGLITDDFEWTLDGERKKRQREAEGPLIRQCKKCFAVFDEGVICPYCGHQNPPKVRKYEEKEGELKKITKEELEAARRAKTDEYKSAQSWDEMQDIAKRRGDNLFWLRKRWGRKFGITT